MPLHRREKSYLETKSQNSLLVQGDAGLELPGADAVFIEVVAIDGLDVEGPVGITTPAAAIVHHIIDTADTILAAHTKRHRIVFAILGGREIEFPQQRGPETARSTETIDAERVVAAVGKP